MQTTTSAVAAASAFHRLAFLNKENLLLAAFHLKFSTSSELNSVKLKTSFESVKRKKFCEREKLSSTELSGELNDGEESIFHSFLSWRGNLTMRNWWPKSVIIDPKDGNIIFGVICWLISDRSSFTSCFTCPSLTSQTSSAPVINRSLASTSSSHKHLNSPGLAVISNEGVSITIEFEYAWCRMMVLSRWPWNLSQTRIRSSRPSVII